MGKRQSKKQFGIVLIFYASVIVLFLLVQLVNWLKSLSPFTWVSIGFVIVLMVVARKYFTDQKKKREEEHRRLEIERLGNLNELQSMKPISFEHYICDVFKELGFDAHVTKVTGDGGKDILIYKNDFHGIVECKRYVKSKVTRPDIQKFHSAIIDCKAEKGYFITTGDFTNNAFSYVLDKPIELIDGSRLVRLIEEITKESSPSPERFDKILKIV